MSQGPLAIQADSLRKVYAGKAAVDGLSLTVPQGCFYGFLGPNGAGKTTTIKMLMGLAQPTGRSQPVRRQVPARVRNTQDCVLQAARPYCTDSSAPDGVLDPLTVHAIASSPDFAPRGTVRFN